MLRKIVNCIVLALLLSQTANGQESSPNQDPLEQSQNDVVTFPVFNGQSNPDLALAKYAQKNYRVPSNFRGSGIVIVDFVIDTNGQIGQIKIINDLGRGTGNEAVKLLEMMPKWTPAYDKDGKAIEFKHRFKLKLKI